MGASPSFISQVNGYNWSQLWLVCLRTGILRNIPKQLLKLPMFQGGSLSSLAWHGLLNSTWWKNMGFAHLSKWMNQGPLFSAFWLHFASSVFSPCSCFHTTVCAACVHYSLRISPPVSQVKNWQRGTKWLLRMGPGEVYSVFKVCGAAPGSSAV